jgi:aspartate racemase
MGPAATADFLGKLVRLTPASRDQEHLRSVVCNFPDIPDRNDAILSNGSSPLQAMVRSLRILERCQVKYIAMPCNTAHYWFDALQEETALPIIHIADAVAHSLAAIGIVRGRVGLLATTATIQAGVYAERLRRFGLDCIAPSEDTQVQIMDVIRKIKAGETDTAARPSVERIAADMLGRGASAVVLACTELPMLFPDGEAHLLDSTAALARECIEHMYPGQLTR